MESDVIRTRSGSRKAQNSKPNAPLAAPAFNPTSLITGAGGFWRADMGVTSSGGNLTQWNDQSSFANNLTNTGTAANTTFSSTGFNTSFSAISIADNTNGNATVTAAFAATATATLFFLISPNATANAGNTRFDWLVTSANDFTTPSFVCYFPSANTIQAYSSGAQGSAISFTNGTPILAGVVFDGANVTAWKNGAVNGSSASFSSNLGAASGTSFGIGNSASGPGAGQHCAFWGITQKAMNTTDWTNLKNWSNSNWGTSF